jgi:hypothetical protein
MWRKLGGGLAVLALAIMAVMAVYVQSVNGPRRDASAGRLKRVLAEIDVPPNAVPVSEPRYYGSGYGYREEAAYRYGGPAADLEAFYESELAADGWWPCGSPPSHVSYERVSVSRSFKKGGFAVTVSRSTRRGEDAGILYTVSAVYILDSQACTDR